MASPFDPAQSISASGANGTVTVSAPNGCAWTASSSATWLVITQGASGTGSGTVAFSTGVNVSTDQRSAQIAVGPAAATIRQDGLVANNCGAGGPTGLEASRSTGCRG